MVKRRLLVKSGVNWEKNIQLKMTQCFSGRDLLQMCFQSKERFVIVGTVISAIMKQGAQYEMQRDY